MSHLIVTYNLLTPPYANTRTYFKAHEVDINPEIRLAKTMAKLQEFTDKEAIVAMQEVSQNWLSELLPWFESREYTLIACNYDDKKSDYMGVALAIPRKKYAISKVDIVRVGDTLPLEKAPPGFVPGLVSSLVSAFAAPIRAVASHIVPALAEPMDIWKKAQERKNALISAVLVDSEQKSFIASVYHMPCFYWSPAFMTVHASLAARHVQMLSRAHKSIPYVLAGDFNIKPGDPAYQLLTTASIDADAHPELQTPVPVSPAHQPRLFEGLVESLKLFGPLTSAYHKKHGKEPDFTNKVHIRQTLDGVTTELEFVKCLDYIFVSNEWTVEEACVRVADPDKFQPHADEPSDHNLLYAQLSF